MLRRINKVLCIVCAIIITNCVLCKINVCKCVAK